VCYPEDVGVVFMICHASICTPGGMKWRGARSGCGDGGRFGRAHRCARNASIPDPALRVSNGMRYFCMRAHTERDWGLFLAHFGLSDELLQTAMLQTAFRDVEEASPPGGSGCAPTRP
jgi:hypothetical protein